MLYIAAAVPPCDALYVCQRFCTATLVAGSSAYIITLQYTRAVYKENVAATASRAGCYQIVHKYILSGIYLFTAMSNGRHSLSHPKRESSFLNHLGILNLAGPNLVCVTTPAFDSLVQ
eukprot:4675144-Pyramimonas_sp.AAC.1